MRLLIITPFYTPDLGPSAPLLTMLCDDLVVLGHQVTALVAVPHFPDGQVAVEFRGRLWHWEQRQGVHVCRVWVPSGPRANLGHRLLTFVVYQLLTTLIGLRLSYDAILVTNPALETFMPFTILGWLRRKPSVFCVWDVYPDIGIHLGIFRHSAVIKLVGGLENFCLRHARIIQVLSDSFIASLEERRIENRKIKVIPPWLDADFIQPLPRHNDFSEVNDLDDHFVVLYAGNLGFSQGLENVLLAAQCLAVNARIQFVIVGDGANRLNLIDKAIELKLRNVEFLPFQPREYLPTLLATADISLVTQQSGLGYDSLPSKAFPILASGRPILATGDKNSSLCKLVAQSGAGICVLPDDPEELAQAIVMLAGDKASRQQMGASGREYVLRYHSRVVAAQKFNDIFHEVIKNA